MYTNIVVKLDRVNADNSTFCARLIKPANNALSYLRITQDFLFESEQK